MPGTRAPMALLMLATGLLLVMSSCSLGPSDRPAVGVRPERDANPPATTSAQPPSSSRQPGQLPPLTAPDGRTAGWVNCTERIVTALDSLPGSSPQPDRVPQLECTTILSRAQQEGGGLGPRPGPPSPLSMVRPVGSADKPVLFVLGEPGGVPGSLRAARMAATGPPRVTERFALVGLDRRGTGFSEPINCIGPDVRDKLLDLNPLPRAPDLERATELSRQAAQACVRGLQSPQSTFSMSSSARDLINASNFLGSGRINALVSGTSSRLALRLAREEPAELGRVVLAGAEHPRQDAITRASARAQSASEAWQDFARWCSQGSGAPEKCPISGNAQDFLQGLAQQLGPGSTRAQGRAPGAGTLWRAVLIGLADREQWPHLRAALFAAADGRTEGLVRLTAPLVRPHGGALAPRMDSALVLRCTEHATRVPQRRVAELVKQWRSDYPLFGPYMAQQLVLCGPFPLAEERAPQDPAAAEPPPALVLGTARDPVTPLPGAEQAAAELPGSSLVTWQSTGHAQMLRSDCVAEAVTGYLVEGHQPAGGMLCPP